MLSSVFVCMCVRVIDREIRDREGEELTLGFDDVMFTLIHGGSWPCYMEGNYEVSMYFSIFFCLSHN